MGNSETMTNKKKELNDIISAASGKKRVKAEGGKEVSKYE